MLVGDQPSAAASEQPTLSPRYRGLSNSLRDPNIEACITRMQSSIRADATIARVEPRTLERQVRLHLPALDPEVLRAHQHTEAYATVRAVALVRAACIGQETEQSALRAHASLLLPKDFQIRRGPVLVAPDASAIRLEFRRVLPSVGHIYQSRLHYLRSARGDTSFHYGLFLPGATHPLTYVALSTCDRPYIADSVIASSLRCDREVCLVITRMYGLPGIPANLMSATLRRVTQALRNESGAKLLLTACNPLLGFTGAAFLSSGFQAFATAPVSYRYSRTGEFTTRRTGTDAFPGKYPAPHNILLARGIDREIQREMIKKVRITNISIQDYEQKAALGGTLPNVDADVWLKQLNTYRRQLEEHWSLRTIHPSYVADGPQPSSRGQCGVSSVWLAQELRRAYGVDSTYCYGDLSFADESIEPVNHHCWIEIGDQTDPERLIIDLTCDQSAEINEPVLCATHDDLVRQGMRYASRTRLTLDELPTDRVWDRFMTLSDAILGDATACATHSVGHNLE